VQDIGGRLQVILIVVYRCAIKVVMYKRNQEEKDVFDMCIVSVRISRDPAFAFMQGRITGRFYCIVYSRCRCPRELHTKSVLAHK
jgi:hypothetical protein